MRYAFRTLSKSPGFSAVAILGPGFGPGLLTSGTTRRDGLITLTDLTSHGASYYAEYRRPDFGDPVGILTLILLIATSGYAMVRLRGLRSFT